MSAMNIRDNLDVYFQHFDEAENLAIQASIPPLSDQDDERMLHATLAQTHATIALAVAVTRLTDSYNGWKDLGK